MGDQKMQLVDWLDDLCVRFIINLPQEELESVARICFQVEEAQWFYEDFIRPIDPSLPSLNLRDFCLRIFQHCPLLSAFSDSQHLAAYQEFLGYKTRVPVRGAILLNHDMDEVVLVKGWKKGASWSFPRGKINKDERDLDCAVREVYEETGYDISAAGLVPEPDDVKAIDVTMREQHMRLFVFRDVPLDTYFEPRTRKEISKIQWYKLSDLPTFRKNKNTPQDPNQEIINANKFYMVAPFLVPLKKWINQQRKKDLDHATKIGAIDHQDAIIDESEYQPNTGNGSASDVVDPAAELKRLLSVKASGQLVDATPKSEPPKANDLLALLRGSSSVPQSVQPESVAPPRTPFDQILAYIQEPNSPHHHRPQESPEFRRQPPPHFPLSSPQGNGNWGARGVIDPVGPFVAVDGRQIHSDFNGQSSRAFPNPLSIPTITGAASTAHPPPHHQSSNINAPPSAVQLPTLGALSHGPVAPKASQLPPPKLSNHTMNLLNVFKSDLRPSGPPGSTSQDAVPSSQSPLANHAQPRNPHQNSLLDLFRSPSAQHAVPVGFAGQPAQAGSAQPRNVSLPAHTTTQSRPHATSPDPTEASAGQRRPSAVHMITRTLPKSRPEAPQSRSTPVAASENQKPPRTAPQQTRPEKKIPQQEIQKHYPVTPVPGSNVPIRILSRPGSASSKTASTTPVTNTISSPARQSPARKADTAAAPTSFTILQRPATERISSSPLSKPEASPASKPEANFAPRAAAQDPKSFQPQVLQRSKPEENVTQKVAPVDQRDALLALFSKKSTGTASGVPANGTALTGGNEQMQSKTPVHPSWPNSSGEAQPSLLQAYVAGDPGHNASKFDNTPPHRWNGTFEQNAAVDSWLGGRRGASKGEMSFHGGQAGERPEPVDRRPSSRMIAADRTRSRLDSMASVASNGSAAGSIPDGMKSPTTPSEAKGFLLDYLNGVVRGEQYKGAKRPGK